MAIFNSYVKGMLINSLFHPYLRWLISSPCRLADDAISHSGSFNKNLPSGNLT